MVSSERESLSSCSNMASRTSFALFAPQVESTSSKKSSVQTRGREEMLRLFPPLKLAWQNLGNARVNIANFIRRRLYQDFGMTELIRRFYDAIRTRGEPPIAYREIILTARFMDEIFAQVYPERLQQKLSRTEPPLRVPQGQGLPPKSSST